MVICKVPNNSKMALVPAMTPRSKQVATAAIDNHAALETPLDFSWKNITDISEIDAEKPRPGTKKIKKTENGKWVSKCLILNHNVMTEVCDIVPVLEKFIEEPQNITWLDLSFNELTKISPCICDLRCMQILYLHGNSISNIQEVDKLAALPTLRKLSTHGNAIENTKNYRWYVLTQIPNLVSFDMAAVTKSDRATASTWKKTNPTKKKTKKNED